MEQVDGGGLLTILNVLVLTRWLHFLAVFVLFGSSLYWFYMPNEFPRARRATETMVRVAAPVAAITGIAWLFAMLANMIGNVPAAFIPHNWQIFFTQTEFGPVVAVRLVLLVLGVIAAALPLRNIVMFIVQLHVGALLLIDQALLGHAAEGGELTVLIYSVHVLAASAWVGGLAPLLFSLYDLRKSRPDDARKRSVAVLQRFSTMALVSVGLIVVSGIANAGFRSNFAPGQVTWGAYGSALSLKLGLVAAMLALAAFNRFIALPRLRAATGGAEQVSRLRLSVLFELVLGAVVIGAAALLGVTPPPQ